MSFGAAVDSFIQNRARRIDAKIFMRLANSRRARDSAELG
jgi:hypothetical protein